MPRRLDPDEQHFECYRCGNKITRGESYPCQGAVPDLCPSRMCDACKRRCELCGLPTCEEHLKAGPDGPTCESCVTREIRETAEGYLALLDKADENGRRLALLADSGCTPGQALAYVWEVTRR